MTCQLVELAYGVWATGKWDAICQARQRATTSGFDVIAVRQAFYLGHVWRVDMVAMPTRGTI